MMQNALVIEACAIIGNLHDDVAGIVEGLQNDFAAGVFSQGAANFRHFQAVIHGIPDHVHERVMNMFEDGGIDFDVFANDEHARKLSAFPSGVANATSEAVECGTDRDHANLHHQLLQLEE